MPFVNSARTNAPSGSVIEDDDRPGSPEVIGISSSTAIVEREQGEREIPIDVAEDATNLLLAVSANGDQPSGSRPAGLIGVQLYDPEGNKVSPLAPDEAYGRIIFSVKAPKPGRWRAIVNYAKNSSFVVHASALSDRAMDYLRHHGPAIACTGCKECLQAAIAVAVAYLAGMAAAAAGVTAVAVKTLALRTGLSEQVISYIAGRLLGCSLDQLVEGACIRMQMCRQARATCL